MTHEGFIAQFFDTNEEHGVSVKKQDLRITYRHDHIAFNVSHINSNGKMIAESLHVPFIKTNLLDYNVDKITRLFPQ